MRVTITTETPIFGEGCQRRSWVVGEDLTFLVIMAGTAYHMEALRKTRVMERKTEAMRRLQESASQV